MDFKQELMGVFVDTTPKCITINPRRNDRCNEPACFLIRDEGQEFWVCEKCLEIFKFYNKHSRWNIIKRIEKRYR